MRLAWVAFTALFAAAGCVSPTPPPMPLATPGESSSALPPVSVTPVQTPVLTPVPTQAGLLTIDYPTGTGRSIPLSVVDAEAKGLVVRLATTDEQARGEQSLSDLSDTGLVQLGPRDLLFTWVGGVCEVGYNIALEADTRVSIAGAPRQACDTSRHIFYAVLTFPVDVDGARFVVVLKPPVILGG